MGIYSGEGEDMNKVGDAFEVMHNHQAPCPICAETINNYNERLIKVLAALEWVELHKELTDDQVNRWEETPVAKILALKRRGWEDE